jgi:hypothetical protein
MNWNIKSPSNIVRERLEANFSFDDRIILEKCQLSLDSQYVSSNIAYLNARGFKPATC